MHHAWAEIKALLEELGVNVSSKHRFDRFHFLIAERTIRNTKWDVEVNLTANLPEAEALLEKSPFFGEGHYGLAIKLDQEAISLEWYTTGQSKFSIEEKSAWLRTWLRSKGLSRRYLTLEQVKDLLRDYIASQR